MQVYEILKMIPGDTPSIVESETVKKLTDMFYLLSDSLKDTLDIKQQEVFETIETVVQDLFGLEFNDGFRFGLSYAKALRLMLEAPEEAFRIKENFARPFEEIYRNEIQFCNTVERLGNQYEATGKA